MTDNRLEALLSADHQALAERLDDAAPTERMVARMKRRAWRKSLVIALATLVGLGLAVWQLPALGEVPMAGSGRLAQDLSMAAAAILIGLVLAAAVISLPDVD
jgi:hypothetical protein